jgi:glucose-1-phosphate adenylyltransferase
VKVGAGARVQDSIIFHDCVIEKGSQIDLAILDKRVIVGQGSVIGSGNNKELPNSKYPDHLYTGISLVGKEVEVPPGTTIGRNCIITPWRKQADFPGSDIKDGETV